MRFAKGHGTGNDFVVLPDVAGTIELTPELVRALCDRHTGIGGDGLLRVTRSPESGRWFMDYHNADGSVAEMCGNGVRVYARYVVDAGLAAPGELLVDTRAGTRRVQVPPSGDITVDMGPPLLTGEPRQVSIGADSWPGVAVDMGNPHVVVQVTGELSSYDLTVAPQVTPPLPHGVNVELVSLQGETELAMRVHERGAGETRSCGTGACAAAVAASGWTGGRGEWDVHVPGGRLRVTWTGDSVLLNGPAELVAEGDVHLERLGVAGNVLRPLGVSVSR